VTLAIATAVTFALLTLAIRTFRSVEQTFADYL